MSMLGWLAVVAVGGGGAVLRLVVDAGIGSRVRRGLPVGTFVVNVTGAFALGLLSGLALSEETSLLAGTAAVGSYTTFSTWIFETHRLAQERQGRAAAANVVASLVVGVAAATLGRWLATR